MTVPPFSRLLDDFRAIAYNILENYKECDLL